MNKLIIQLSIPLLLTALPALAGNGAPTPEPSSMLLVGGGAAAIFLLMRRKRSQK